MQNQLDLITPTAQAPGLAKYPRLGQFSIWTVRDDPGPAPLVDAPATVAGYWRQAIAPALTAAGLDWTQRESLVVVCVTARRRALGWHIVSTGLLDTILAHPREIFRPVILANSSAFILMHNHPSGDPGPSEADIKLTRDIRRAGQLLKIDLLDHVIMGDPRTHGGPGFVSLRELGYFYES